MPLMDELHANANVSVLQPITRSQSCDFRLELLNGETLTNQDEVEDDNITIVENNNEDRTVTESETSFQSADNDGVILMVGATKPDYKFSSSIRPDSIPTFDGTNWEFTEWIDHLEATLALAPELFSDDEGRACIMRWRLRGQAVSVFDQLTAAEKTSYRRAKEGMMRHYNSAAHIKAKQMEFKNTRRREHERVSEFATRFHQGGK